MAIKEHPEDTIAAVATPPGEGGVGIVRLSGPKALAIAGKLFISKDKKDISSQKNFQARYGQIVDGGQALDEALLLVMRAPNSYTGQDVAELQAHGAPAVMRAVMTLAIRHGARSASPGEFTKRAFLNGRLDLVQAEAVLDLIQAKTERSVRWAASQLEGRLSSQVRGLRENLITTLAHLEAAVDFPDDETDADTLHTIEGQLSAVEKEIKKILEGSELGILAKRGLRAVLLGRPNVGKSSLLNTLTRSDRVIVTPVPGTTRDVVEEETLIGGFPVRFMDTAGIQDTDHEIEKKGIARSRKAAAEADLILFVVDASQPLTVEDKVLWKETADKPAILVLNKSDLPQKTDLKAAASISGTRAVVYCSCVKEGGDDALREAILQHLTGGKAVPSEEPVLQSIRQKEHLEQTLANVERAHKACAQKLSCEFVASDVRLALDHLGRLVGEVVTDDVLEILFSRFCIGK